MTETNRAHGYYSETLDSNSTIAELDQRLQAQRVRLQNATDKLHEEAKKTGLFRSNPLEVHSLQNKADFEAEVLQDIEDGEKEEMFLGGSVQTPPIALMLSFQS